ncbi:FtsX-like permease family protein [Kitasatospora azatica]|uniref:FtsX-like permease family protein n=1 Tax=Kitasatospora azatica TaxID=58347 RepID=UPI00056A1CC3|nr:FtsX-like permease family protein [Kitasatospora azatica]
MKLTAWRVALRIARRDALRAKGRSALVLAMIALPVLGVAGADVVYRSSTLTPAQKATRQLGTADLLLQFDAPGLRLIQAPFASDGTNVDEPRSNQALTPEQQRSKNTDPATLAAQLLPAGSALTPVSSSNRALATSKDGLLRTDLVEADLTDPIWRGRLNLVAGRAPATDHEIAATRSFLDSAGLKLGAGTVLRGLGDQPFVITGVAEHPDELNATELIGRPGTLTHDQAGRDKPADDTGWLVRLPAGAQVDWAAVQQLNRYGFVATSRSVVLHPPARSQVPYFVQQDREPSAKYLENSAVVALVTVVGMALLEVVLLAGPAFAVGARRSRRQLGLLAAGGGDRAQVRAVVLSGGLVLGLAGALLGVLLAVLLVALARPWLEPMAGQRFGSLTLAPLDLLGVAAIGLVTGLLAAVVPAFQAARQDVVAALTGRGSVKPPSKRLTLLGLLMLAGGAALALFGATSGLGSRSSAVLGGSMIAELGMVACTPMVVGLFGKLGRWLPLGPRLALRDSVRHRGRTAPAVAAVMAAVAGSVAVGVYGASADKESREHYTAMAPLGAVTLIGSDSSSNGAASLDSERAAVERAMPELGRRADILEVRFGGDCVGPSKSSCGSVRIVAPPAKRCPTEDHPSGPVDFQQLRQDPRCVSWLAGSRFGGIVSGDADVLHNLFVVRDSAVDQAAAAGKVVVFDPSLIEGGKTVLRTTADYDPASPERADRDVTVDAVLATPGYRTGAAYITPQTAAHLGLTTRDNGSAWLPAAAPSSGAEQQALAEIGKVGGASWSLQVERGFQPHNTLLGLGLTAFAALVALGAAGIATGLASADSQQDLTTLAAVGAAPRIRRSLSGFQCGVIAAMGAVLGTVCGLVPAVALREAAGASVPPGEATHVVLAFPWLNIGLTLVALPLLAVLLATLLTRSRITLLRRAT